MEFTKQRLYEGDKINNFRELVEKYKKSYSDKVAFKYRTEPKSNKIIEKTYRDFAYDITKLGTALLNLNLRKKKIALIAPNRYEWCVSYLAITTSDIVIVPLDKSLPDNEIESLIIRSKADAVIFDKKYESIFTKIMDEKNSNVTNFICMDDNIENNKFLKYSELLKSGDFLIESGNTNYSEVTIDNNAMSIMLFTSGTTAISKAACLSQANICADIYALSQMAKIYKEDVFLSFLPLHHTFESTCTFLYGTSCGITIAFCDGLKYASKNLKEYNITGFVCVPLMLERIYKKIQKGIETQGKTKLVKFMSGVCNFLLNFGIDIRRKVFKDILNQISGSLRILIAGGAPMNKEAIQGYLNMGINLLQGYGLTETSPVLAGENDKYKKLGSVGFPLPSINIKIDNPNSEGIGEIMAEAPTVMLGYYENEKATKEVFEDKWFHTGDLGFFDKDGFLFVTGRKKDVIVLKNGKNIYPEELEILINQLPYVLESIVYGKPTDDNDLNLSAKVVYDENTMKELYPNSNVENYKEIIWQDIKNINKTMPAYKYIRDLIITTDGLIKTTTQKIKRHEEIKRILG